MQNCKTIKMNCFLLNPARLKGLGVVINTISDEKDAQMILVAFLPHVMYN